MNSNFHSYSRSRKIVVRYFNITNFSWRNDPLCKGPYPKVYAEFKKTLSNLRAQKFGNAPTNGTEVLEQIEINSLSGFQYALPEDEEEELGKLFYDVQITDKFDNCIFASSKSLSLIKENTNEKDRFFVLDGTFRITPKGVWQQVLILHINFGLKVRIFVKLIKISYNTILLTFSHSRLHIY